MVEQAPLIRQCAVPPSVKGASSQYKGTSLNSAVTYVTYSSHIFESGGRSRSLVCQSNGQWSAKITSPSSELFKSINQKNLHKIQNGNHLVVFHNVSVLSVINIMACLLLL